MVFNASMGKAAFISHQWASKDHPDPEFKQLRVLQSALRHMLGGLGFIPLDPATEAAVPAAKRLSLQEFKSQPVFLWYDYFSCPQLERDASDASASDLAQAIRSIPAYIAQCSFFLGLCPVVDTSDGKVLTPASWTQRAWCRFERTVRELSSDGTWVLIKSETSLEVVGSTLACVGGSTGEGQFSQQEDRERLGPVLRQAVVRKLALCLKVGDFPAYRRLLNMQGVYFRGLHVEPVCGLMPGREGREGCETIGSPGGPDLVEEFCFQNGFAKASDMDSAGWSVLHYAALGGNTRLISCLLKQRADPNRRTTRDQPNLGCPRWTSALDLAVLFKQNDAARLLIAARAKLQGGVLQATNYAAISDNAEGIRLLCAAGADPLANDMFGTPALCTAAGYGAMEALEELLFQTHHEPLVLSRALCFAVGGGGGSVEMVDRLIHLRADVNYQHVPTECLSPLALLITVKSLQHRFGRVTALSTFFYHWAKMTPLIAALLGAQHEAAAALIAAGADPLLRNRRGRHALDFAQGQSIPSFLQKGLAGDLSECQRLVSLVLAEAYIEI